MTAVSKTVEQHAKETEQLLREARKEVETIQAERDRVAQSFEVAEQEAKDQAERLQTALAALRPGPTHVVRGHSRRTNGKSATVHPHVRGPGTRGRPIGSGKRRQEVVDLMSDGKARTIPEIAKALGMKDNYLYRVLPSLVGKELSKPRTVGGKKRYKIKPALVKTEVAA